MISTTVYRIVQGIGWVAALAGPGIVLGTIVSQALPGPTAGQSFVPPVGMWRMLGNTLVISSGATVIAIGVGALGGGAAALARRAWLRTALRVLMLVTILTIPSVHAYAWQLLLTSDWAIVRFLNNTLAASGAWGARGLAAVALGMWLWPIPAWVIIHGLRRAGARALELSLLDARPWRALLRGALPVLRGPIVGAGACVFVAAALNASVPPLMLASDVWSVEMLREAELARSATRPAGYLFWLAWPMLAVVGALVLAALPGVRRMMGWQMETTAPRDLPRFGGSALPLVAGAVAACAALMPVIVFSVMLIGDERYTFAQAVAGVWRAARGPVQATAIVAVIAAAASFAMAVACDLGLRARQVHSRFAGRLLIALTLVTAVLPPSLVGTSLVSFYAGARMGDASGWNLYDDTPVAWVAAILARFAFVPVCLAALAGLVAPTDLRDQAKADGATGIAAWRFARWPFVRGSALVGAAIVGMLAISEIQAAALVKAPRWGDDGLGCYLDAQMHYGRHGQTLALALLMYVPIVLAGVVLAMRGRRTASPKCAGSSGRPPN